MKFEEFAGNTMNGKEPKLPDELLATHACNSVCNRYPLGPLITFHHREFLRNNFAKLFADKWTGKKPESEILKPIGKSSANPTISKLKFSANESAKDILKSSITSICKDCTDRMVLTLLYE